MNGSIALPIGDKSILENVEKEAGSKAGSIGSKK
jgi:hypothetical protein